MNEKHVLVEHSSSIHSIIQGIFQTTHRIKITAFDISQKYIIFGVNSGGIYIFNREPCQFLKLIPSTHGAATILAISPNDDYLAIAFKEGVLVIVEGFIEPIFQPQIFTEHEPSTLTALKWSQDDLHCGDMAGKVSVITVKNSITKAIFQPPIAVLMTLDSEIVQIDSYSHYLLVSTKTRSLLCNTQNERYRQIGKKARDGPFGACFYNLTSELPSGDLANLARSLFQAIAENETFCNDDLKVFCARPGARLWQANGEGNVVYTHQFRSSLDRKQSDLIHFADKLEITKFNEDLKVPDSFAFGRLYRLGKFILVFQSEGFFIFDPFSSCLLFWSGYIRNIHDIKILNSSLYIWHNELKIAVISLLTIEEIILMNLLRKKYKITAELCKEYQSTVEELIPSSRKLHLISILESKLLELNESELLEQLKPIFESLRAFHSTQKAETCTSGIVTINNGHEKATSPVVRTENDIVAEQYKINKIHRDIETSHFCDLIKYKTINEIYDLFQNFLHIVPESINWCGEMFLKCLTNREIDAIQNQALIDYAKETFFALNKNSDKCKCNFPLPSASDRLPKFYAVGLKLFNADLANRKEYFEHVPYLFYSTLDELETSEEIQASLPLLVQFSSKNLFKKQLGKFTYDMWDEALKLLFQLRKGICLNCSKPISVDGLISIKSFAMMMVDSLNARNAIKLLRRYAKDLKRGEFDAFFYQFCIFSAVSNVKLNGLTDVLQAEKVQPQFSKSVEVFLRRKHSNSEDLSEHLVQKFNENFLNCDFCELPLQIPILEQAKRIACGHNYHEVCWIYKKNRCFICSPVDLEYF